MLKYRIEPATDDFVNQPSASEVATYKMETHSASRYSSMAGIPLGFPRPRQYTEQELMDEINQPTKPTSSGWLPFRARTSAVFGHVLHLNNNELAMSIKDGTDMLANSRRVLYPLIPPITEMHLPGWVPYKSPSKTSSVIVMRFTPSLHNPNVLGSTGPGPVLELRLAASDEVIISIMSLRAIAHTHLADICLPGEVVDARLAQRLVAELPGNVIQNTPGMDPLMEFLRNSTLQPARGRLITPPVLDGLGLPSWLFYMPETDPYSPFLRPEVLAENYDSAKAAASPHKASEKKSKTSKRPKRPKGKAAASLALPLAHNPYDLASNALTQISYLFAGVEIHRPVETAYDGWKLSYTSIEAGVGGGHRAELALAAQPAADKTLRRPAEAIMAGHWLRSMYNLARGHVIEPEKRKKTETEMEGDVGEEGAKSVVRWLGKKK